MSDPPTYDQDLLSRLNALKKSSIQFALSKPIFDTAQQPTPESDLSARLRSLRNGSSSPSSSTATRLPPPIIPTRGILDLSENSDPLRGMRDIDDKTLDELLAELGPDDQWKLSPDDPDDIQKLLDEARIALPSEYEQDTSTVKEDTTKGKGKGKDGKEYLTGDLDMSVFALDDEDGQSNNAKHSELEHESLDAQDIVARLLDETKLERQDEPVGEEEVTNVLEEDEVGEGGFTLPSAPSKLPEPTITTPSRKSLDFESDITSRMAAFRGLGTADELGLPSAPTFKPIDKAVKAVMKKFTDEEIESWCIICQDNATVNCIGCDGDLYCANCWKEGHMGPDVGWEERKHQWVKFKKPN